MRAFLLAFVLTALLTGCAPQVKVARCGGVLVSATEIATAAHCLSPYDGGRASIRVSGRSIRATPVAVDNGRDVARLTLSEPVLWPVYATYLEPHVGATGFVMGGCPLRQWTVFRVAAVERVTGNDGVARWEWAVRDGQVACPGDSGAPIWSDAERGAYYGIVSRYDRLRMQIGNALVLFDAGATIYSGAGEW